MATFLLTSRMPSRSLDLVRCGFPSAASRRVAPTRTGSPPNPTNTMRRLSAIGLVCALAGLVLLPATAGAQLTITLEGTVRNAQGSPIASAQVGVTNPETNERRAAQTNDLGRFRFLGLAPGRYEIGRAHV